MIYTYKNLIVWKKSILLVKNIYILTRKFPREEQFGITSQMRRAAVSILSNIAEGRLRGSDKEYRQFLRTAMASGGELETQLVIAKELGYCADTNFVPEIEALLDEIMKMFHKLVSNLEPNT